ncbi:MAG: DNA polymerase III subunit delta [Endomicrobium sp.]|jgi:DNA polymerase-3 subunit delta|nr:DNA polymerase III subunit delta [Endomicrobium sp.]
MSIVDTKTFSKLISSKRIFPVYLFAGEESYLIELCLRKLDKLLEVNDFNKEIFYILEAPFDDILNALHTPPFLGKRRVVVVKSINKINTTDVGKFISYLSNVVESSCLILLYFCNYKKETVVKRKELINKCISSENCIAVNCRKQYENEVKEFIKNEFTRRNKTISYDIISKIIADVGNDLLNISSEIEKVSLFIGENIKNITNYDFEKIMGITKETNTYVLSSFIESKNLKKSMFILEKLLGEGEEPIIILSVILSTLRKLLSAKSMIEEQKMSIKDVGSNIGIHNLYSTSFFTNLKKHNIKKLLTSFKIVLEADISIKSDRSEAVSVLEKTILYICE